MVNNLTHYVGSEHFQLFGPSELEIFETFKQHALDIYLIISEGGGVPSFSRMMLTNNHSFTEYEKSLEVVDNFLLNNADEEELERYDSVGDYLESVRLEEYYQIDSIYKADLLTMWEKSGLFFIDETRTNGVFNVPVKNVW